MQHHVDIADAQTRLAELLEVTPPGDEIIILKHGQECGRLYPIAPPPMASMSPQEKAEAFREWAASHSHDTPLLSDEAIIRESIYTREDEQR